jgi:predicted permease
MFRAALVASEVGLSLMLLVGASLMLRTLVNVQTAQPGFEPERILTVRIPRNNMRYAEDDAWRAHVRRILERLESTPAIRAAGLNTWMHPMGNMRAPFTVDGSEVRESRPVVVHQVNEHYTAALGIQLRAGRMLDRDDLARRAKVAILNEAFVRRYTPDGRILGRVVRSARLPGTPAFEVAGVVEDRLNDIAENQVLPEIYIPYTVFDQADYLIVAGTLAPSGLQSIVRQQIYSVDRDQPVMEVRSLDGLLQEFVYSRPKFNLLLLGVFSSLGLLLALGGIYGVVAHSVAQRTREFGVRIALGASFSGLMRMVLLSGARVAGLGIVAGGLASFVALRYLSSRIWMAKPDFWSVAAAVAILFLASVLACLAPAMRAARVAPATALRNE